LIALDTNLLVYAHRAAVSQHARAQAAIEEACNSPRGCGIALPCVTEFYGVVTHPAASGRPSTPAEAAAFVRLLRDDGGAVIFVPGPDFGDRLLQVATDLKLTGPRIFDLQIALCAIEGGARELWTHDRQFVKVPGLRVVDPLS
jgi:hypothetical protein